MKRRLWCILLALIAPAVLAGAFGASADVPLLDPGQRMLVELSQHAQEIAFVPGANSDYAIMLLPAENQDFAAYAELYQNGELLAGGEGGLSARLTAGADCVLRLTGRGRAYLEVSRNKLSRCFAKPLDLQENEGYSKLIAQAGDVHWYCFTSAEDGLAVVSALPEEDGLRLSCILLDDQGRTLTQSSREESGGIIYTSLQAGKKYYVRVSGEDEAVGQYTICVVRQGTSQGPESVEISLHQVELKKGDMVNLAANTLPEGSFSAVHFASSDDSIVGVTQTGVVTARAAGVAAITATGYGGIQDTCVVTVARVPLSGIAFETQRLSLRVGEEAALLLDYSPADATDRGVRYLCRDETIARVNEAGVVTGLQEGKTSITVTARDGGYTDTVEINVKSAAPGLYALLVGQQNYADGVNEVRTGSINSVESIARMLGELSLRGGTYQTKVLLDSSAAGVYSAIRTAFSQAKQGDKCLFYITCHGNYSHGMSFFQMFDGSVIAARDLERELRQLPCQVVVIVDCCGSGGVLGKATQMQDFNQGVVSAFAGNVAEGVFASGKYKVLASAALDQDSYRVSFSGTASEKNMATIFARALCDAAGWSMEKNQRSAMRADADFDRKLSLNELWLYTSKRVMWYLNLAAGSAGRGYVQNVQVYPENDTTVLFQR